MSNQLRHRLLVICVFGFTAGASAVALNQSKSSPTSPQRNLASTAMLKIKPEGKILGKHLAPLQVSIQAPTGIASRDHDVTELVGWIRLNQPLLGQIQYKWELPEGVHKMSGEISAQFENLPVGETQEVRISVSGFSQEELKLISLIAFTEAGEEVVGNSASLTSRPEDSFEMLQVATGVQKTSSEHREPALKGKIIR